MFTTLPITLFAISSYSLGTFYDIGCVKSHCSQTLLTCDNEVTKGASTSACRAVAACIETVELTQPGSNPDACAAGLTLAEATPAEKELLKCITSNKCVKFTTATTAVDSAVTTGSTAAVPVVSADKSVPIAPLLPPPSAPSSFLQNAKINSEKFALAEKEAEKEEKEAEAQWLDAKKKTDESLGNVHKKMKELTDDLAKSSAEEKKELLMLEESRKKENEDLKKTEDQLEALAKKPIVRPNIASFFQKDNKSFIAPLQKAAQEARQFAEKVRKQEAEFQKLNSRTSADLANDSSFIQSGSHSLSQKNLVDMENESNAKAEKSLALAEKSLSKLNQDLDEQKKELKEEEVKAKREHEALVKSHGLSLTEDSVPSFLQLAETEEANDDPLSPKSLAAWRDKFEDTLRKAREAAGVKTPFHSSLMQLDLSPHSSFLEDDKLRQDERNVKRLQDIYNEQMAKLKQDNAQLMAEARDELEKARDMKSKLDAEMKSSLLETRDIPKYDAVKEDEKIRELERQWKKDAAKIASGSKINDESASINAMIEEQKTKEQETQVELDRMRQKLNKDIALMHKDVAMISLDSKTPSSFLQSEDNIKTEIKESNDKDDPLNHAKLLLKQLDSIVKEKPIKPLASSSFLQLSSSDSVDNALSHAEEDLKKLQQQLKEQTDRLRSMARHNAQAEYDS